MPLSHIGTPVSDLARAKAFYEAAIDAGGHHNGKPGSRPHYRPNYYAAFVFDPAGANIKTVCDKPG